MYCPLRWGSSSLYQVRKASERYANDTMSPVSRISFDIESKCLGVKYASRPKILRIGIRIVITIARPLKMAPATKYGAKTVECHPGTIDTAKSHDTTECTESTSGVARAAR